MVASNFKWKEHRQSLSFFFYEQIYFISVTYLFDFGFVLKFQFSFVIFQFHKETCIKSISKMYLNHKKLFIKSIKTNKQKTSRALYFIYIYTNSVFYNLISQDFYNF